MIKKYNCIFIKILQLLKSNFPVHFGTPRGKNNDKRIYMRCCMVIEQISCSETLHEISHETDNLRAAELSKQERHLKSFVKE